MYLVLEVRLNNHVWPTCDQLEIKVAQSQIFQNRNIWTVLDYLSVVQFAAYRLHLFCLSIKSCVKFVRKWSAVV